MPTITVGIYIKEEDLVLYANNKENIQGKIKAYAKDVIDEMKNMSTKEGEL